MPRTDIRPNWSGPAALRARASVSPIFREEFLKHQKCSSSIANAPTAQLQAEEALGRILQQMEDLCRRDDACEVVVQLLRQFDAVTKLSAFSEPRTFN